MVISDDGSGGGSDDGGVCGGNEETLLLEIGNNPFLPSIIHYATIIGNMAKPYTRGKLCHYY